MLERHSPLALGAHPLEFGSAHRSLVRPGATKESVARLVRTRVTPGRSRTLPAARRGRHTVRTVFLRWSPNRSGVVQQIRRPAIDIMVGEMPAHHPHPPFLLVLGQ